MKQKRLSSFKSRAALLVTLLCTLCAGQAWADDVTITIDKNPTSSTINSYLTELQEFTIDGVTFKMKNYNPSTGQIRGNQGSNSSVSAQNFCLYNTTAIPGSLKSISITVASGSINDSYTFLNTGTSKITTATTSGTNPKNASWSNLSGTYFCIGMANGGTYGTTKISGITITYTPTYTPDPTITVASSLAVPNYVVGTTDPTYETLTVNGSDLIADITLSLGESSNFEMSTNLSDWTNHLTLTQTEGSVINKEVAIRLKAGLSKGEYDGTLTLSSTGAPSKNVILRGSVTEQTTYSLINSTDKLVSGKHYIIVGVNNNNYYAMGEQRYNSNGEATNRVAVNVIPANGIIPETTGVYEFVIYGPDASGNYSIYNTHDGYLCASSSLNNYLAFQESNDANGKWRISFNDNLASIVAQGNYKHNMMQYYSTNTFFSCYSSASQKPVYLYVKDNENTPTVDVTIGTSGYASYCSQNALDFSGTAVKAYKAKVDGDKVKLTQVNKVPAEVGVILHYSTPGSYPIPTIAGAADAVTDNEMVGVLEETEVIWNNNGKYNYILQQGQFYKASEGKLRPNRAYLSTSYDVSATDTGGARGLEISFAEEAGINGINVNNNVNDNCYDLQGRRVHQPKKGLYIVNGKKVLVK